MVFALFLLWAVVIFGALLLFGSGLLDAAAEAEARPLLTAAAEALEGGEARPALFTAVGRLRGRRAQVALTKQGGRFRVAVEVSLPPAALHLNLRPQTTTEERLRDKGLAVDVEVGDAAFDAAFLVEAAPSDVARALLDAEKRRALLFFGDIQVETRAAGLSLEVPAWRHPPAEMKRLLQLAGALAAGIPAAFAAADKRAVPEAGGAPYRAGSVAAAPRQGELAALRATLARRALYQRRILWGMLGFLFAVAALGTGLNLYLVPG